MRSVILFIIIFFNFSLYSQPKDSLYFEYNFNNEEILCTSFCPFSDILSVGLNNGHIAIIDIDKKSKIADLYANDRILDMQFSPLGSYLAVSDNELNIRIWNFSTYRLEYNLRLESPAKTMVFSDAEKVFYYADLMGNLVSLELKSGKQNRTKIDDVEFSQMSYSVDPNGLWLGSTIGDIYFYNLLDLTSEQFFISNNSEITEIISLKETNLVYFLYKNGRLRVIDRNTFEYSDYLNFNCNTIYCGKTSMVGNILSIACDGKKLINLYLPEKRIFSQSTFDFQIKKIEYSSNNKYIVLFFEGGRFLVQKNIISWNE